MSLSIDRDLYRDLRKETRPMTGDREDFDPLLALVGDSRFVLIGEASHGTHEFYRIRAEITKRLIREKGFSAVAVEADWPDAYRVNRYVQGRGGDTDGREAFLANEARGDFGTNPIELVRFMGGFADEDEAAVADEGEQRIKVLMVARHWVRLFPQLVAKPLINRQCHVSRLNTGKCGGGRAEERCARTPEAIEPHGRWLAKSRRTRAQPHRLSLIQARTHSHPPRCVGSGTRRGQRPEQRR